jgi:hypothetical protein
MVWNVLTKRLGVVACMLGTCGQPLACMAESVQPAAAAAHVEDVVIGEAGLLVGQVSNESGQPLPSRPVEVVFAGGVVAATQTDATGSFRVSGLREGVHQIRSGATTSSHRLWPKEAAPPQVQQVAHVSCTEDCPPPKRNPNPPRRGLLAQAFATYPVGTVALIGAGIGAAIAIPIATSQKPASP